MRKTLLLRCEELYKIDNNLDVIDMSIVDYMQTICASNNQKLKKIVLGNSSFTWVAYQKILDDMPYLRINNKEAIARRLTKLIKSGLLVKHCSKKDGNKTFFGMGKNWDIITGLTTIDFKVVRVSTQESKPLSTIKSYNNSISDNSINNKNNDLFLKFWETYNYKIGKQKAYKAFNRLSEKDKTDAISGIKKYDDNKPEWKHKQHPSTYLNGRTWEDEVVIQDTKDVNLKEQEYQKYLKLKGTK